MDTGEKPKKERSAAQKRWDKEFGQLSKRTKKKAGIQVEQTYNPYYICLGALVGFGLVAFMYWHPTKTPEVNIATINDKKATVEATNHIPIDIKQRRPVLEME